MIDVLLINRLDVNSMGRHRSFFPYKSLVALGFLMMFILLGVLAPSYRQLSPSTEKTYSTMPSSLETFSQDVYSSAWWNTSFHSRMPVNFTDIYSVERQKIPVDLYVNFSDGKCWNNSIRIVSYGGTEIPSQVWNRTYYGSSYLKSATVTFYVNVSAGGNSIYWVYYSDQSVGLPNYTDQVIWGKNPSGWYWFNGTYYSVATNYPAHSWEGIPAGTATGKLYYGTFWVNGTRHIYWGANMENGLHWNPDSPTTSTTPLEVRGVTEAGPLFVTYEVVEPLGSDANATIWYRLFEWGWIGHSNMTFTGATTSYTFRNNEYVFSRSNGAYRMPSAIWKLESGQIVDNPSFTLSSQSIQHALWMGFYDTSNGKSAGCVDLELEYQLSGSPNWNYVMHGRTGYYNYWDRQWGTISVTSSSYIYEKYMVYMWDASHGPSPFERFANATQRDKPLNIELGERQSFTFEIHVEDLGGDSIADANVTLYYPNGTRVSTGTSKMTDTNGNVTFPGLTNTTYLIKVWKNSSWLDDPTVITRNQTTRKLDQPGVNGVKIILPYADVSIEVTDLGGTLIKKEGTKNLHVQVYNSSKQLIHGLDVDSYGIVNIYRLPRDTYTVNFSYADSSWFSYTYGEIAKAAHYSIPVSQFTGDITYTGADKWVLPLGNLNVTALSDDDKYINDTITSVTLSHQNYTVDNEIYPLSHKPVTKGAFIFYRILNGTWDITLSRSDSFGQSCTNNSEHANLNGNVSVVVRLGITTLNVGVKDRDDPAKNIEGALVKLYSSDGSSEITSGTTGEDGRLSFTWLKSDNYKINATVSGSATTTSDITTGRNYQATCTLYMPPVTYPQGFTILTNNNGTSSYNVYYNDNFTLSINYINRTSTGVSSYEDKKVAIDSSTWVNFTIYFGFSSTPLATLYWSTTSSYNVYSNSSGQVTFNATIFTRTMGMNASSTFYRIEVNAYTTGYTDPVNFTYMIVVNVVPTEAVPSQAINIFWNKSSNHYFTYNDTIHNIPVYHATVATYNITLSVHGIMAAQTDGTYLIPASVFNNLDAGIYTLTITFSLTNYTVASTDITLTIIERPTQASVSTQPSSFTWGASNTPTTTVYEETDSTAISESTVNITVTWLAQDPQNTDFNVTSNSYTYDHTGIIAPNGTWRLRFIFEKKNFVTQIILTNTFVISTAPTDGSWKNGANETTVPYSQPATFRFCYNRTTPAAGVEDAKILWTNWTASTQLTDLGNGVYQIAFGTTIAADNLTVTITIGRSNHSSATLSARINILVPLSLISNTGLSDQNPIEVYWTQSFMLNVSLWDLSRSDVLISQANVQYLWNSTAFSGSLYETSSPGVYNQSLDANVVTPGLYVFYITAIKPGCQQTTLPVYVLVRPTPSQLSALESEFPTYSVRYEENATITFSWQDTLSNVPITTDLVTANLTTINTLLPVTNPEAGRYQVTVDTDALQLSTGIIYQIVFSISKTGYATPDSQLILLTLDPALTALEVSLDHSSIEENQYSHVVLTATYTRATTGTGITGANITVTFNGQQITLTEQGNGIYSTNLSTADLTRDTYPLTITANKSNYQAVQKLINLIVSEPTVFIPGIGKVAISTVFSSAITFFIPILGFFGIVVFKRVTMPYPLKVINKAIRLIQKGETYPLDKLNIQDRDTLIQNMLNEQNAEIMGIKFEETSADEPTAEP
ncbi:MAG: hypothetical protein ACTSW4_00540 [Candidatus Ranarchaeia archaeon]